MECGHSLSTLAIRVHVQESLQRGAQEVPQCCGIALPRSVLETALTKADTDLAMNSASQSPDTASLSGSGDCDDGASPVKLPLPVEQEPLGQAISMAQSIPSRQPRYEAINIDNALAQEAFKSFKAQQREQFERVSTFELHQRKALSAHHQCTLKLLAAQHEASKNEKMEQVLICRGKSFFVSLLMHCSIPTTLNTWKSYRSLLSMIFAKLKIKRRRMLQQR